MIPGRKVPLDLRGPLVPKVLLVLKEPPARRGQLDHKVRRDLKGPRVPKAPQVQSDPQGHRARPGRPICRRAPCCT